MCFVILTVNGIAVKFLVDSGASVTCINSRVWNELSDLGAEGLDSTNMRIKAANEGFMEVLGQAKVAVRLNATIIIYPTMYVLNDLSIDAVLGTDIINENRPSSINFDSNGGEYIMLRGVRVDCSWQRTLRADHDYFLPPGTHRLVWCDTEDGLINLLEGLSEGQGMNCMAETSRGNIPVFDKCPVSRVAYCLTRDDTSKVLPVLVANITSDPLRIYAGQQMALLEPVVEVISPESQDQSGTSGCCTQGAGQGSDVRTEPEVDRVDLPDSIRAEPGDGRADLLEGIRTESTAGRVDSLSGNADCATPPGEPETRDNSCSGGIKPGIAVGQLILKTSAMSDQPSKAEQRRRRKLDRVKRENAYRGNKDNAHEAINLLGKEFGEYDSFLESREKVYWDKQAANAWSAEPEVKTAAQEDTGKGHSEKPGDPDLIGDLIRDSISELDTDEQKDKVQQFLLNHKNCFSMGKHDLGRVKVHAHTIDLEPGAKPFRQAPRRQGPEMAEQCDKIVKQLLDDGRIREGYSPFASGVVMVRKKDGSARMCVDYRQLNDMTIKDAWPLPRIDDTLDRLAGAKFLSSLDITSAYYQLELKEEDRYKTAFVTPKGQYCYNVLPFGLTNAPATFSRLMSIVMYGLPPEIAHSYLDDVIVIAKSFDEMLENLDTVLMRFFEAGLKFGPTKCRLFRKEVAFLGHIVGRDGVRMDPAKIDAILKWPEPKNKRDVQVFYGLANYYRRFVKIFSEIAFPLTRAMSGETAFEWTTKCQEAFKAIKQAIAEDVVLAYPDFTKPFILDCDASDVGIGAALSQFPEGEEKNERPIAFYSKTLSKEGRNYCVTRRELLAVILATQHFRPYLGNKFTVRTDHSSLRWLQKLRNVEGQLARWQSLLQEFNFTIEHRPGKDHGDADALSRRPCYNAPCRHCDKADFRCGVCDAVDGEFADDPHDPTVFSEEELRDLPLMNLWARDDKLATTAEHSTNYALASSSNSHLDPPLGNDEYHINDFANDTFVHDRDFASDKQYDAIEAEDAYVAHAKLMSISLTQCNAALGDVLRTDPRFTTTALSDAQQKDPALGPVYRAVSSRKLPIDESTIWWSRESKAYLKDFDRLVIKDDVLCRKWYSELLRDSEEPALLQTLLPNILRTLVLKLYHDEPTSGHLSWRRTLHRVQSRFYWYGLRTDCELHVRRCDMCTRRKRNRKPIKAPLQKYINCKPFARVSVDIMGPLPVAEVEGIQYRYVAVMCDNFTKWVEVFALPDHKAERVAHEIWERWFSRYGVAEQLHSDNGREFVGEVMRELCKIMGVEKTNTCALHPESDGQCERLNRVLQDMLAAFINENQDDWPRYLQAVAMAYRSSLHSATGVTPYFMVFGREVVLPMDLLVGFAPEETVTSRADYVAKLRIKLRNAHEIARRMLRAAFATGKGIHDKHAKIRSFNIGDAVWLHNPHVRKGQTLKFAPYWHGPYIVIGKISTIVYRIQLSPRSRTKIIHIQRLKPYEGTMRPTWFDNFRKIKRKRLEATCGNEKQPVKVVTSSSGVDVSRTNVRENSDTDATSHAPSDDDDSSAPTRTRNDGSLRRIERRHFTIYR